MGMLWYNRPAVPNTTIRVVFKTASPNANSGVYIRFPEKPRTRGTPCTTATRFRSMRAGTNGTAPGVPDLFAEQGFEAQPETGG